MDEKTRGMAARQDIVTWHTPEEKLPTECDTVVITFSGVHTVDASHRTPEGEPLIQQIHISYTHALGCGSYCKGDDKEAGGWLIDGLDEEASDAMTVEAWCDLEPYIPLSGREEDRCT